MSTTVLACGAWLKNAACLLQCDQVHWSAVHGNLSDPAACAALSRSVDALVAQAQAAGTPVQAVAHDLHPDFFSTQLALEVAQRLGVPAIGVQHHHAHLAAVLAEHGLSGPVLGWALDGVGLGSDGQAWGGELLYLNGADWRRLGHLHPLALPGGDRAAREPWRMAASALQALGRGNDIVPRLGPHVGQTRAAGVQRLLQDHIHCPPSTSAGRWFDAAAALLASSGTPPAWWWQQQEAEAAVALEHMAQRALLCAPPAGPLPGAQVSDQACVDLRPLLPHLLAVDADNPAAADAAALGFHWALADALVQALWAQAHRLGVRTAVLGGGCLYNRILRERLLQGLQACGLQVYMPQQCGDAGLALGQAWVAAQSLPCPAPSTQETLSCA
jgi:hydrogenase maturation protein HypF